MFNGMPDFQQSIDMMKNMWAGAASGSDGKSPGFQFPGMNAMNAFGMPVVDMEELEKRIRDLKSVESWLTLNLNILQSTIQGLEVQKATLSTLHGIAEQMKSATSSTTTSGASDTAKPFSNSADFAGANSKLVADLMENMSSSMTQMMAAFPSSHPPQPAAKKPTGQAKPKRSPGAKTAKSRARPPRA